MNSSPGARRLLAALVVLAGVAAPRDGVRAQVPAAPELRGTVTLGEDRPLPGATVVLHRVDPVDAGEIDSLRTGPGGAFRFQLPTVPDPGGRGEVYFASVNHQGVLYFGPPVTTAVELDSVYRIQVHDTVWAPASGAPLTPTVRYMLVEQGEEGWQVTDLLQVVVEGDRTLVAADSGVTWRYPLPTGHRGVQVGGGDVPPAAARTEDGDLLVTAPLPPGPRQVVIRYTLDSLSVEIPVPGGVGEMDLLVREPAPPLQVRGLEATESVEMEPGVRYRRFAGVAVQGGSIGVVQLPPSREIPTRWLAVLLGLTLTVLGIYAVGRAPRGRGGAPAPREGEPTRDDLIRQVAELDEALEETPEGPARIRLMGRRRDLVSRLRNRP